jgi:hypothetical protein
MRAGKPTEDELRKEVEDLENRLARAQARREKDTGFPSLGVGPLSKKKIDAEIASAIARAKPKPDPADMGDVLGLDEAINQGAKVTPPGGMAPGGVENPFNRFSDEELQAAIDQIHAAQFGPGKGKGIPYAVTVSRSGRVVISAVDQKPGPYAVAKAREIFGEDVEIVEGTARTHAPGPGGQHAEARGLQHLGDDAEGARQLATHHACENCEQRQVDQNVVNGTGVRSQQGQIVRPMTTDPVRGSSQ